VNSTVEFERAKFEGRCDELEILTQSVLIGAGITYRFGGPDLTGVVARY
jgi:hypothetical protein